LFTNEKLILRLENENLAVSVGIRYSHFLFSLVPVAFGSSFG